MTTRVRTFTLGVSLAAAGVLASCGEPVSDEYVVNEPATFRDVTNAAGDEVVEVSLTERAAERIGIEVVDVERGARWSRIPLAALIYDPTGDTWVYTVPEPLTYVREPVDVATEEGQVVAIADGPPVGTDVVVVGVPELWGAETGIGH